MNKHLQKNKIIIALFFFVAFSGIAGVFVFTNNPFIGNVYAADEDNGAESSTTDKEQGKKNPDCPECPECPDPAKVVLRGLDKKKKRIKVQETNLANKQKELERYEEQIDEKLEKLTKLKVQINKDLALLNKKKSEKELLQEKEFEDRLQSLVKTYASMKPKNAAKIVDKMELDVARKIFSRMRESSAAEILADVDSQKAAKITEHLTYKKK